MEADSTETRLSDILVASFYDDQVSHHNTMDKIAQLYHLVERDEEVSEKQKRNMTFPVATAVCVQLEYTVP